MSDLATAFDQLKAVLAADAGLIAFAADNFGRSFTQLDDYRELDQLYDHEYPAQLFYVGDGTTNIEVGNYSMDVAFDIIVECLYIETDHDQAMIMYKQLPDLMIKAVMRNHTLNGAVHGAWVGEWRVNNPALQPTRGMSFKVVGSYQSVNA